MDKIIERGMLFDFYGELLTDHQKNIYSEAVYNDLSLSELSEETGISRQGVHDLIKRCDKQLSEYEDKLKLIEKFQSIKKRLKELEALVDGDKTVDSSLKEELRAGFNKIIEDL